MKKLKALACSAFILFLSLQVTAQKGAPPLNTPDYNKPKIFADLPETMVLDLLVADRLFQLSPNAPVNVMLTNNFNLKGNVVSSGLSDGVHTLMIRVTNRNNALLSISKFPKQGGGMQYTGRMFSREHGDALIIMQDASLYTFRKIGLYDLISE